MVDDNATSKAIALQIVVLQALQLAVALYKQFFFFLLLTYLLSPRYSPSLLKW
jgi:hypothetical protein